MIRKIFSPYFFTAMIMIAVSISIISCRKDTDGSPSIKPGNMTYTEITPKEGPGGTVVTLKGSGLGQIRSIVFEKNNVPASFTTNLNTDNAVIFRVPDTTFGGPQNIIFTNVEGKELKVPFTVIALPTVSDVSNYNFTTNSEITLIGNNLEDVTKVVFTGSNNDATIVSKSRKQMTIRMPATPLSRTKLDITNSSGTITTNQEFVSLTNNFVVYTDTWGAGAFNSGVQNWSWGTNISEVNDVVKTGTKALRSAYVDGGMSLFLGCTWGDPNQTFGQFYPERQFLTFYARAVDADVNIRIQPDGPWSGPASSMWNMPAGAGGSETVTVPKNRWAYFKIPASTFKGNFSRINFIIAGSTNKTVYFDDILWVK